MIIDVGTNLIIILNRLSMKKTTFTSVKYFILLVVMLSVSAIQSFAQSSIKLTSNQSKTMSVTIEANGDVTVEGATGTFENKKSVTYTLTDNSIVFKGDILAIEAKFSKISEAVFENCSNLKTIDLSMNELHSIDVSSCSSLDYLNVMFNKIDKEIDFSNNTEITGINCAMNQTIPSINITNCSKLVSIDCSANDITSLDLKDKPELGVLTCGFNEITSLDLTDNVNLQGLNCQSNKITELNLSNNTKLNTLICFLNQLNTIDLTNNSEIVTMDCGLNPITHIDVSPLTKIAILDCSGCEITDLDVSANTKLIRLNCHKNKLSSLDLSANTELKRISCFSNNISGKNMTDMIKSIRSLVGVSVSAQQAEGELVVINTQDPQEKNVCTKSDVALAKELNWLVKDFNGNHKNRLDYEGLDDVVDDGPVIKITTQAKVGTNVSWKISANGDVKLSGVSGTWKNGQNSTFTIESSNIRIEGDVTYLDCSMSELSKINTELCPTLQYLNCSVNSLNDIDVSKNNQLIELKCEYNKLTSLNLTSNTELTGLWCYFNKLESVDLSANKELRLLSCSDNKLKELDLKNNVLIEKLSCSNNPFGKLDVSMLPNLEVFWCANNNLSDLNLSANVKLNQLICQYNTISQLDLSNNKELVLLWLSDNNLSSLNLSNNTKLCELWCYNNNLKDDNMSDMFESMPTRAAIDDALLVVLSIDGKNENNICTKSQVKQIADKGWKVCSVNEETQEIVEYEGSEDLGIDNLSESELRVYADADSKRVFVENAPENSWIMIANVKGMPIGKYSSADAIGGIDVSNLPADVYFVVVGNKVMKLMIK